MRDSQPLAYICVTPYARLYDHEIIEIYKEVIVIGPVDKGDNHQKENKIQGLENTLAVDNQRVRKGRIGDDLTHFSNPQNLSPSGSWRSTEVVPRFCEKSST